MSKATQKVYKRLIDEATSRIVMNIFNAGYDITREVQKDLLLNVRAAIDERLKDYDERQRN